MAKFCGYCGSRLDETTGLCPKCDSDKFTHPAARFQPRWVATNDNTNQPNSGTEPSNNTNRDQYQKVQTIRQKTYEPPVTEQKTINSRKEEKSAEKESRKAAKAQQKEMKKAAKAQKKAEKIAKSSGESKKGHVVLTVILVSLLLALLTTVVIVPLVYFNVLEIPFVNELIVNMGLNSNSGSYSGNSDTGKMDEPSENGNSDAEYAPGDIIDADKSSMVMTEKEAFTFLNDRGFAVEPITTEYDMEGNFSSAEEISKTSKREHPVYSTTFKSSEGETWAISVIEKNITALPISYNSTLQEKYQVVLSESGKLISYDSSDNIFVVDELTFRDPVYIKTLDDGTEVVIVVVENLDSDTLDVLTENELNLLAGIEAYSPTPQPTESTVPTEPTTDPEIPTPNNPPEESPTPVEVLNPYDYSQKLTVTAPAGSSYGTATLYEWSDGDWSEIASYSCTVGKNGIGPGQEGSKRSPQGIHKLGVVLTSGSPETNMPIYSATSNTGVVDDTRSIYYNMILEKNQVPSGVSFDNIGAELTNGKTYATIFIEHNGSGFSSENVVSGGGSAIGLRGRYGTLGPTNGDVDISSSDMVDLLSLLDSEKNPMIEIKIE